MDSSHAIIIIIFFLFGFRPIQHYDFLTRQVSDKRLKFDYFSKFGLLAVGLAQSLFLKKNIVSKIEGRSHSIILIST